MLSEWVQFSWNLKNLPSEVPKIDPRYAVELATPDDRKLLQAAISRSVTMEPAWNVDAALRIKLADDLIDHALPAGEITFIAIKHGSRIIAAAGIREEPDKASHLPVGVCVLNEYRCRGLGTFLLYESLRRLRERGLENARVVTKKGVPADRFLYPKFGGERAVLTSLPA